jgi:hypothetical protein
VRCGWRWPADVHLPASNVRATGHDRGRPPTRAGVGSNGHRFARQGLFRLASLQDLLLQGDELNAAGVLRYSSLSNCLRRISAQKRDAHLARDTYLTTSCPRKARRQARMKPPVIARNRVHEQVCASRSSLLCFPAIQAENARFVGTAPSVHQHPPHVSRP